MHRRWLVEGGQELPKRWRRHSCQGRSRKGALARDLPETALHATSRRLTTRPSTAPLTSAVVWAREVLHVFQQVPSRRLVVLGKAGAGKTVLTVRFMLSLLPADNEPLAGRPVPVLFSLATWNPASTPLATWLEEELVAAHPSLGSRLPGRHSLAHELFTHGRILLVLDGLDELAGGLRSEALRSLSESLRRTDQVLLTSRLPEYRAAVAQVGPLADAAAVTINDLEVADLQDYLPATRGTAASGSEWVSVLAQLASAAPGTSAAALRDALRTPLMVYLARIVYRSPATHPNRLLIFSDSDRIQAHLLDRFVAAAYDPGPGKRETARMVRRIRRTESYLAFLARNLIDLGTPNFRWWQFNRGLDRHARLRLAICVGLLVTVIIGLFEAPAARYLGLLNGFALALVIGPLVGLSIHRSTVLGRVVSPVPARIRDWRSWRQPQTTTHGTTTGASRFAWRFGLLSGLVGGLVSAATSQIILWPSRGAGAWEWTQAVPIFAQVAVATTLANGTAILIAVLLARRLEEPVDLSQVLSPTELLRADRSTARLQAVLCGLAAAVMAAILYPLLSIPFPYGEVEDFPLTWSDVFIFVRSTAIPGMEAWATVLFLLVFMSTAWGRFVLARMAFALTGRLPLRLMTFLREAHLRGVLRQSGSVYQFRHLKLRDRLAHGAEPEPTAEGTSEGAAGDPAPVSPL